MENKTSQRLPSRRVALVGNPNVGKSAIFWQLTGRPAEECNVPGSSIAISQAPMRDGPGTHWFRIKQALIARRDGKSSVPSSNTWTHGQRLALIDTPGASSVFPLGQDEMALRHILLDDRPDALVFVADAKNLRRSLALLLEVIEFGLPVVFDLNMIDESENLGLEIDLGRLGERLGCLSNGSVAIEGHGLGSLADAIPRASPPTFSFSYQSGIESALKDISRLVEGALVPPRALGILLLVQDEAAYRYVERHFGGGTCKAVRTIVARTQAHFGTPLEVVMTEQLYSVADRLMREVLTRRTRSPRAIGYFGRLAQNSWTGIPIAIVITLLMYFWVGEVGATLVVDTLHGTIFEGWLIPSVSHLVDRIPSEFVRGALMDPDFGLLPTGVFLAFGMVLPVLFFFFLFFAILEDSGYLPRLSILLDRLLRRVGLNGKGVLPLVMGFSCVTMAVITTRMLDTKKERTIAIFLLILGIPCAPLLSVQFLILRELSWTAPVALYGIIAAQMIVAGSLANRLLGGDLPDFIMEIPRMRVPKLQVIFSKTWRRSVQFMKEAVPIFMLASFIMFLLNWAGALVLLEHAAHPIVGQWLGLPDKAVQVFLKTIIRRENGATELHLVRHSFDGVQLVVSLLVMTFLMPCLNAIIVIIKEQGLKTSMAILGGVMFYCILTGTVVNAACRALGVTFM